MKKLCITFDNVKAIEKAPGVYILLDDDGNRSGFYFVETNKFVSPFEMLAQAYNDHMSSLEGYLQARDVVYKLVEDFGAEDWFRNAPILRLVCNEMGIDLDALTLLS